MCRKHKEPMCEFMCACAFVIAIVYVGLKVATRLLHARGCSRFSHRRPRHLHGLWSLAKTGNKSCDTGSEFAMEYLVMVF